MTLPSPVAVQFAASCEMPIDFHFRPAAQTKVLPLSFGAASMSATTPPRDSSNRAFAVCPATSPIPALIFCCSARCGEMTGMPL